MREAVTEAPHQVTVRVDAVEPPLGVEDVLVRVERVGICGSDAHVFDATHTYLGYPLVQGHEIVGRVAATGTNPHPLLAVGDRVVIDPTQPCGQCVACRRGRGNCCEDLRVNGVNRPGGLADCLVVDASRVYQVGDLDPDVAVLVEPIAIAMHALERARVTASDTVLITGAGSIGRSVVLAARARGARVIIADRAPNRRRLARLLGADEAVEIAPAELGAAVEAFTAGEGCTVVIDTTGAARVLEQCIDHAAASATIVIIGISPEQMSMPIATMSHKELSVLGSRNSRNAFPSAIEAARANADVLRQSITHRFPLEEAAAAIRLVLERTTIGKVVVEVS